MTTPEQNLSRVYTRGPALMFLKTLWELNQPSLAAASSARIVRSVSLLRRVGELVCYLICEVRRDWLWHWRHWGCTAAVRRTQGSCVPFPVEARLRQSRGPARTGTSIQSSLTPSPQLSESYLLEVSVPICHCRGFVELELVFTINIWTYDENFLSWPHRASVL